MDFDPVHDYGGIEGDVGVARPVDIGRVYAHLMSAADQRCA